MEQAKESEIKNSEKPIKQNKKKPTCCIFVLIIIGLLFLLGAWRSYKMFFDEPKNDNIYIPEANIPTPAPEDNTTPPPSEPEPEETPPAEEPVVSSSKDKIINFFVEIAVIDDAEKDRELQLARWTMRDVSVGVAEGQLDPPTDSCLNSFINDFNALVTDVKLRRDDTVDLGIPKIKIYYWSEEKYNQSWTGEINEYGFEQGLFNDDSSFKRAQIYISEKMASMDDAVKCQMVRHEMMHAIGFWGHSDVYPESIMSLPKTRYIYPDEDKKAIQLMYNSGLALKSNPSQVRDYLNNNYPF